MDVEQCSVALLLRHAALLLPIFVMCSGSEAEVHCDKDESSGLRRLLHRLDQMTHQLEQNYVSLHAIRTELTA